ncbi:MAG: methylated-DNA--[protein]-cysteine S-methyltransferase [Bacteroidales bacterium]|jgi:AraC family transcriptional regulator of adaptative response/methylated-DNA-[protein]-cysteine methyltransferase|nr:methylated-DNA--[protein]-cysteine S-methyltransferase [Bacteroidales bacterium]
MVKALKISTPVGEMIAAASGEGVCLLEFHEGDLSTEGYRILAGLPEDEKVREGTNRNLRLLRKQLTEYFRGKRREFTVPLVIRGTQFQVEVWKALQQIPFGETISYKGLAQMLAMPGSARAVAGADAKNRIAIVIPCHRVIGSNGELTGYAGGLKVKEWLLNHERKFSGKPVELTLI